ncbi:hypothetical protein [Lysinibacillus sp. CTST325]
MLSVTSRFLSVVRDELSVGARFFRRLFIRRLDRASRHFSFSIRRSTRTFRRLLSHRSFCSGLPSLLLFYPRSTQNAPQFLSTATSKTPFRKRLFNMELLF